MSNIHEILKDVYDAIQYKELLSMGEVFQLLEITKNCSIEDALEKLLDSPINQNILKLPREKRLAVLKTSQTIIGQLFLLSLDYKDE